ncbi:MAG: hypothetical protein QNJ72_19730 [Pleurocapsa sp. MO_226.B13]|nr:hypothetical protein [Pleurocapsa sp. MO_226.B13]
MTSYLTPDVKHEENWSLVPWISNPGLASDRLTRFKLTLLAYVNLWAARNLAVVLPREWEQYLKTNESVEITPSLVQRDFYRIISQIGKITKTPIIEVILLDVLKDTKKPHVLVIKLSKKRTARAEVSSA